MILWGVATGAVVAIMLLAGGDNPESALNGLKNITIVSALPFVIVMLLLCVAVWRDLSKDPMVLNRRLYQELLEHSVAAGLHRYEGEDFELSTEIPAVKDELRCSQESISEDEER